MARKQQEQEEFESNLQSFIPLLIVRPWAGVQCPHCNGIFQIDGKRWREPLMSVIAPALEIKGRCCPYCMKVSLIPLEFFPKKERARKATQRG